MPAVINGANKVFVVISSSNVERPSGHKKDSKERPARRKGERSLLSGLYDFSGTGKRRAWVLKKKSLTEKRKQSGDSFFFACKQMLRKE